MPRPKRLLMLCAYPPGAAATRFRICAYLDGLRAAGIETDVRAFVSEPYFARMYAPTGVAVKAAALGGFELSHLALALRAGRYDAVFVQREAALVGPPWLERYLAEWRGLPLVYDLDDAVWLDPDPVPGTLRARFPRAIGLIRGAAKGDLLLSLAAETIAGSKQLAAHARLLCPSVTVLPTVVFRDAWRPLPGRLDGALLGDPPILGWIGTHSTAGYLEMVLPALERLAAEGLRFRLRLRGASRDFPARGFVIENLPWRRDHEADDFAEIDIGLGPIRSDPWAEGKSGFKQLQYMAVGVPMVTSLVGGTRDFIEHGKNALVADGPDDWYRHLRDLLASAELRARLARAGRDLVCSTYCVEAQTAPFVQVIERALARAR